MSEAFAAIKPAEKIKERETNCNVISISIYERDGL